MVSQGEEDGHSDVVEARERTFQECGQQYPMKQRSLVSGELRVSLACGNTEVIGGHRGQHRFSGMVGLEIDGRLLRSAERAEINHRSTLFSSGIFGERLPLRYYLSAGMLLSGLFTALFGLGYFWNIHMLWYFVLIQVRASILHSGPVAITEMILEAVSPSQLPPGHGRFGP